MTLAARNHILLIGVLAAFILFAAFSVTAWAVYSGMIDPTDLPVDAVAHWWLVYARMPLEVMRWEIPALHAVVTFSVAAGFILRRFFRKTVSFEMFFFTIFILSISLDAFRIGQVLIYEISAPPYYGVLLTRMSHFGHFFGMFSLFTASLYAVNISYQKLGTVLGMLFFLAFVISATLPVDSTVLLSSLMYEVGYERGLIIVFVGFELFTLLNFLWAAVQNASRDHAVILVAVFLSILGREVLFFLGSPVTAAVGGLCLITGTVLFGRRTHALYLWA